MVKVTFKDVGQGDTIILEWEKDGIPKVGFIDCNKRNCPSNPLIDFLEDNKKYFEISFVILSHPHFDHFSGLFDFFSYCEKKKVVIDYFIHSSFHEISFLKTAVKSTEANKELEKLFVKVRELISSKIIIDQAYIDATLSPIPFPLNLDFSLEILLPTTKEYESYLAKGSYDNIQEERDNNPKANLLSTLIQVCSKTNYLLLTSDVEIEPIRGIARKRQSEFKKVLSLGQSPHHGAKSNHLFNFWNQIKRTVKTPIVFSVGKNTYGHPSGEILDFFIKANYTIYSTNLVGDLKGIPDSLVVNNIRTILDVVSIPVVSPKIRSKFSGDKVFCFYPDGNLIPQE